MNRLLSQLNEVSLSLQRTQDECDMIAKRYPLKVEERSQKHFENSSRRCGVREVDGLVGAHMKDGAVISMYSQDERVAAAEPSDRKVENLIHLAESITEGIVKQQDTAGRLCMV